MFCPNCSQEMTTANFDSQSILHCLNCGASFFEENSINRISQKSAEILAQERKTAIIYGRQKLCPKDQTPLSQISSQESIPDIVVLFRCNRCQGVFSYAEDLVNFKKAQTVKVNYFRLWNKPLPSLNAVLVMFFLALFSATIIFTGISNQKNITQSQAKDLVGKIIISSSNRYLFLSFSTAIPVKTEVRFTDKTTGESFSQTISNDLKTIHILTTDKINFKDQYYYIITLIDEKGRKTTLEEKLLNISSTSSTP